MAIDLAQIRKDHIFRDTAPIGELLNDLREFKSLAIREHRTRVKIGLGCLLAAVVAVLIWHALLALAVPLGIGLFLYFMFFGSSLKGNPQREEFARDLISSLEPDTSAAAPYSITIGLKSKEQKLSEAPFPLRKNGKQQLFSDEWLSLQGRFLDGSEFTETVSDLIRRRTFSNNRNKTKTKSRIHRLISLKIHYPASTYGDARRIFEAMPNAVKVPDGTKLKEVNISDNTVALKALVTNEKDLKQANAMLFLGAYSILNRSRHSVKGGLR